MDRTIHKNRDCQPMRSLQASSTNSFVKGVSFSNLHVHGFGSSTDYQKTVGNVPLDCLGSALGVGGKLKKIQILRDFRGLVRSGKMCIVLGWPGSGCSTFLKTISGEIHGLHISTESNLQYQDIPVSTMHSDLRTLAAIHFLHPERGGWKMCLLQVMTQIGGVWLHLGLKAIGERRGVGMS